MIEIGCGGLLFDLDGVLVDSTPAVARVWTVWARRHGLNPDEIVKKAHGRPSMATIRELLPNADHEAENRKVERMEIEDVDGVVALPGAIELLQSLSWKRWAIVTSGTRALALVRIGAAGIPVAKHLITADDIKRGKPDPEPYLKGAASLGVAAKDCVVVEDAPAGIRAGKAAGACVIALRTTTKDKELRAAGVDWIVDDCSALQVEIRPTGLGIRIAKLNAAD